MSQTPSDETLCALASLETTLRSTIVSLENVLRQAEHLRDQRRIGASWRHIVENEDRPLIVETVSTSLADLAAAGSRFRRAEARALHAEGLSMEVIGGLFGVTRQRVSVLLKPGFDLEPAQPVPDGVSRPA